MKEKMALCLIAILLFLTSSTVAIAQKLPNEIIIQVWTDKPYYKPGEEGKLYILIVNNYDAGGLFIDNITITYPWWPAYIDGKWSGNDTVKPTGAERGLEYYPTTGDIYQTERSFKVPSDSRAKWGDTIEVEVFFAGGLVEYGYARLTVITEPSSSIEGLDRITTLLAVQIILTVILVLVLAATIYLSAKKLRTPPTKPPVPSPPESGET